jgi:hypothetical protein
MAAYYRQGLERVVARGEQRLPRRHPVHWCSNNLMSAVRDTGALLYRRMTGDNRFREYRRRPWTG